MLKKDIMGIRSKVILNRYRNEYLIMEAIAEEQEKEIDVRGDVDEIYYITDNNVKIGAKNIFLYGEINLDSVADINLLKNTDIITQEVNGAANIPSNFDYDEGVVYSDEDKQFKFHDTWNKVDWFKFNHCLLGKPNRIIIYRIPKSYVPRNRSTIRRGNNS